MFGPYRLDGLLGKGGMGEVHRAYDTEQDRPVALKVLPAALSADPAFRERFRREAKVASQLTDPHVVPIHRHGEIGGQLFLDMRLVDGEDLAVVLQARPLAPEAAVRLVEQVASALDAAHDAGLVHRDVKPSNVFLTRARPGSPRFAYLGDFGIARDTAGPQLTATGAHDRHARLHGARAVHRRRGGRPLGRLRAGLRAARGAHRAAPPSPATRCRTLMHAHLALPPPRPSLQAEVPAAFDAVVARGMAKDPGHRYAHAGALAAAARAALHRRPPTSRRRPRPRRRAGPGPGSRCRGRCRAGGAHVERWLVAPGQRYAAGAPLVLLRLGHGHHLAAGRRPRRAADAASVAPGAAVRSGRCWPAPTGPVGADPPPAPRPVGRHGATGRRAHPRPEPPTAAAAAPRRGGGRDRPARDPAAEHRGGRHRHPRYPRGHGVRRARPVERAAAGPAAGRGGGGVVLGVPLLLGSSRCC
jgi:serine/threonine-protein kinase